MIKILKNGVKSKGYMMKCDFDFNKKEIWKKEDDKELLNLLIGNNLIRNNKS